MKLLFIAPFPVEDNKNDGLVQRVASIDTFVKDRKRIYLQFSYKRFLLLKRVKTQPDVVYLRLNIFLYFWLAAYYLLTADIVYFHTIFNMRFVQSFLPFIRAKKVLDIHGVIPEELEMTHKSQEIFHQYNKIEKVCFKNADCTISVTKMMQEHYRSKYPEFNYNSYLYGIKPSNLSDSVNHDAIRQIMQNYDISADDTVILYSGGVHVWQNIDLMLASIKDKPISKNCVYILLLNKPEAVAERVSEIKEKGIRIYVNSVNPHELSPYYQLAHYGFVLRDDNVVNRVANPTKLIEYLYYRMTPIVLSEKIGDFLEYDYSYIKLRDFMLNDLKNIKADSNKEVVLKLMEDLNSSETLKQIFK